MVLPTSSPDAESGARSVAPWIERIANHFRLIRLGTIALVDYANDAQIGPLVRGLALDFPDLWVVAKAADLEDVPTGAVVVLVGRAEDATWLNLNRPIFADRAFKVVLWCKRAVIEHISRKAPDFFNWISRRFECPEGPPRFAVAGLHAALLTRAWAIDFRGKTLNEVFGAAFPKRTLVRVSAAWPDEPLLKAMKDAGPAWLAWTHIFDERGALRVRQLVTNAHRVGRNILENARGTAPDAWPVFDAQMAIADAMGALEAAGLSASGRLAAMLDLEPEAIALAAEELARGITVADIEATIARAVDPGAALEKRAERADTFDPVRIAACRVPPPMMRAFGMDTRVHDARAKMRGRSGPSLPPLAERITGGENEFNRLMRQLLRIYTNPRSLFVEWHSMEQGVDVLMSLPPATRSAKVAFSFYWSLEQQRNVAFALQFGSHRASIGTWNIIAPREFSAPERVQFDLLQLRKNFRIHFWGQTEIVELLRKCPPLLARYYPEEARAYLPGYDGTDFTTLATRYREKLAHLHNRLKTIGIPPEARPRESRVELPLAELFIPLQLVPEERDGKPQDLLRILQEGKSGVILADPGMGKSTLLAYVALVLAGGAPLPGFSPPSNIVPMHISLRDFVLRQQQRPGLSFLDYLELDARERFGLSNMHRAFFEATLRMGEAFVLLDGLDEVGNETARHVLSAAIRAFQAEYPESRFWVTSRIYGYTENVRLSTAFSHFRIARLEKEQIDDFVKRWYEHQIGDAQEAAEQAASLSAAIERTAGVKRLAGNPLLLTLMAFIHQGLRRLPKDRGELYDKCIEMLLKTWEDAKHGEGARTRGLDGLSLNVPTQRDYLAHLAFYIQQRNQSGKDEEARGLISRREAIEALARRHLTRARRERPALTELEAREEMAHFLDYVCDGTGLVLDRGNDQLSFIHLSFQEYLAAWVFLCDKDLSGGPSFFLEHLGDPAWEEVLLLRLYIVLWGGGGGEAEFDQIVGAILRALERRDNPQGWLMLVRAIRDDLEFAQRDQREILQKAIGYCVEHGFAISRWFDALNDVRFFGERARELLHHLITEMRLQARKSTNAIALLQLEAALFSFPKGAATWLQTRTDLGDMLAGLVRFSHEPSIRDLLAKHGKPADFVRGLQTFHFVEYQILFYWMLSPISTAAEEGAAAVLWFETLRNLRLGPTNQTLRFVGFSPESAHLREVEEFAARWPVRSQTFPNATTSQSAQIIAHAAYATLLTKKECKLPFTPDLTEPRIRFSFLLYELANGRDTEANTKAVEDILANPAPELRPLLEAVDLITPTTTPTEMVRPAVTIESPAPKETPQERVLFSWLHLSDMHFGHRDIKHRWDQKLVLEALHRDILQLDSFGIPKPETMFVTGDIAFSGAADQYADAQVWLNKVAATHAIARERIFIVPGNHDIDRNVDRKNRNVNRMIGNLRDGRDLLDEVFDNADDRAQLTSRMAAYLEFAAKYPALQKPDPLYWAHAFVTPNGLPVRVIGLPTPLLAAGDIDKGKLRLGKTPLAATLNEAHKDREFVLVLTHHPLRDGWLADQHDVDGYVRNRAHVHLFGHVHEADSEMARSGSGAGILRIAAGAVHGDNLPPGIPASHGYSVGAVVLDAEGQWRLRLWPRRWSEPNKEFRLDVDNIRPGQTYAEHPLDLRIPLQ